MKLMKRALALLLCFLVLTNGPISAFATEGTDDVVVETTTTTETVETCEECGGSDAHTDDCSFNIVAPLTTEAPDETTEPTTTPTEEPTEPTVTPTLATSPAISTDPVGCTECNQTDGHMVGCLASFTEVEKTATFVEYPITLYYNPVTEPDSCKSFDKADFGENFTFTVQYSFPGADGVTWYVLDTENWEIFADTDAPYSYIQSDYVTFDLDAEDKTEQILTDEDHPGVSVRGELPSNVILNVSESLSSNIDPYKESMLLLNDNHIALDIKLLQDDTEYQPEKSVTVTMEASTLSLQNGHHFTVYHIHNGVLELLGIYTVADNKISFTVSGFSDFVISSSTATNSNVHSYYEAVGSSGNGNFNIVGVYYEDDGTGNPGNAHIIIKNMTNMNIGNANKIDDVFVNGELGANIYPNENTTSDSAFGAVEPLKASLLILKDKNGEELGRIGDASDKKSGGYIDIMVKGVQITDTFDLTVKSTTGTVDNAFNIGGAEVKVILNYGVTKNVYSVNGNITRSTSTDADGKKTAVSVFAGETVVYKITATNDTGSTIEISGANITDFLPSGAFDENSIYISNDPGGSWDTVTVTTDETGNKVGTLKSDLTLATGTSTTLYLKATVLSTLKVSEETTYTNEAQLGGGNTTVIANDKADIIVSPPVVGNLTITKEVKQDYINDTPVIPDGGFEFKIIFGEGTDTTTVYPYTIGETTGTIASGGTIKLSDGQTAVISDIPVGTSYTVEETLGDLSDDYTTTVNGATGVTASGTIQLGSNVVNVVNTYKQHFTDLTITKTGAQTSLDENQSFIFDVVGPNGFKITVTINGNGSVTIKDVPFGEYTVTENTDWSWRYTPTDNSKTITLVADGENVVAFNNNRSWIYWLSGDSHIENQFTVKSKDEEE